MCRSVPQIEAAWTRTKTSLGPGVGTGISTSSAPGPGPVLRSARIGVSPGVGASAGPSTNESVPTGGGRANPHRAPASGRTERRQDPVAARADLVGMRGGRLAVQEVLGVALEHHD